MMSDLAPLNDTEEKANFTKLSRLLIDAGTPALRHVFDQLLPPGTLKSYLSTYRPAIEAQLYPRRGKRILSKKQWEILYPPRGHPLPSSENFDITLLFVLLRSICGLTPPLTGWDNLPATNDVSQAANLARIKYYRNEVYGHIKETCIPNADFERYWSDISSAILSIGVVTKGEIDTLKSAPIGEKNYIELMEQWCRSDFDLGGEIKGLSSQLSNVHAALETSLTDMSSMLTALSSKFEDRQHFKDKIAVADKINTKDLNITKGNASNCGAGIAYRSLGAAPESLEGNQLDIEYQTRRLNVAIATGDKKEEGAASNDLGIIFEKLKDFKRAVECHTKDLEVAIAIGNKKSECRAYRNLGNTHLLLGSYERGIEYYRKCLKLAVSSNDNIEECRAYGSLGTAYRCVGDFNRAIECYTKHLNIAIARSERCEEGCAYGNLGIVYHLLGDFNRATMYHTKHLNIAIANNDKKGEGCAYGNLGIACHSLGEHSKAIQHHTKDLEIAISSGDKEGEGCAYNGLGNAYHSLGDYKSALRYHSNDLDIAMATGDKAGESRAYGNLGAAFRCLGDHERAIECYKKVLSYATTAGDQKREGLAYDSIGSAYYALGEANKAIEYHSKCLHIAMATGDKESESRAYGKLGVAYRSLEGCRGNAECQGKTGGDRRFRRSSSYASISNQLENEAVEHLCKALDCWEILFDHLKDSDKFKILLAENFKETYKLLVRALIHSKRTEDALAVSERGRARSLSDILHSKYNLGPVSPDEMILSEFQMTLTNRNSSVCYFHVDNETRVLAWVLSDTSITFHESDFCGIKPTVEEMVNAAYAALGVRNSAVQEIQGATLLSNESHVFEHSDQSSTLPVNLKPLEMLYSVLFAPMEHVLNQAELVVIPDGALHKVPFAALRDSSTGLYLVEKARVRVAPSLNSLKLLQECPQEFHCQQGALVVGNPEVGKVWYRGEKFEAPSLPIAEEEACAISNILDVEPLIGADASKDVIMSKLQQDVGVVHIAAHGDDRNGDIILAPATNARMGGIPVEKDYILTMDEVQQISVRAQLVVLSCGHSGRGEIKAEGVVGMARAFVAAGARAVLATLWDLDDSATMAFMQIFYGHLKRGASTSTSLQKAMLELRTLDGYEDPKHWAPFVLIGDDVTVSL